MQPNELSVAGGYAVWAATYDGEKNALITAEEKAVERLMIGLGPVHMVLGVATGTGRYALQWARRGADVVALDQSPEMLAVARERAEAEGLPIGFAEATLEEPLPFPANAFGLVICALALCHIADLRGAVSEMGRVLRPGGHLLITDFHPNALERGWRTTFVQGEQAYQLPNMPHSRPDYLDAVQDSGCALVEVLDVRVGDAPADAFPDWVDVERLMREDAGLAIGLIILGQKSAG